MRPSWAGIAVARGSHRLGFLDGKTLATGEPLDERTVWHWNPFTCGDVIMFHSLAIHQGRDNATARHHPPLHQRPVPASQRAGT